MRERNPSLCRRCGAWAPAQPCLQCDPPPTALRLVGLLVATASLLGAAAAALIAAVLEG